MHTARLHEMQQRQASPSAVADLALAAALWGGLYVVSAAAFSSVPPATLTLLRLALGVGVLTLFGRLRGESTGWNLAPHRSTAIAAAVGATSMLLQFGGTSLTSGVEGAVVTMSTPVFVLLFGHAREGESIAPRNWLGIVVATLGVAVLALRASGALEASSVANALNMSRLLGVGMLIGAGATWALYSSLGRPIVAAIGARRAIALTTTFSLPLILPFAAVEFAMRGIDLHAATEPGTLAAIVYLGIGATAIGWSSWYRGYAAAPPRTAAGILFLQPLVAAVLGVGLLHEPLDAGLAAGALLLLGGVALITRGP